MSLWNEHGSQLTPPFGGPHWATFAAFRAEAPAQETALRDETLARVHEVLTAHPVAPAGTVQINSTVAGTLVLRRLPADWSRRLAAWLNGHQPPLHSVDAGQMYGMMLAWLLAYTRLERWQMTSDENKQHVYVLLDARGI
jgi:hypothetical protein